MNNGIDTEMVRQHYAGISDEELIRIVTEDAVGLTGEGKQIALAEIERRKLNPSLLKGIDAQTKLYSQNDIDGLAAKIQGLNCPVCGSNSQPLNGGFSTTVVSGILFTNTRKSVLVACPDCLDNACARANTKTALLGWWGFPWGIIRSAQALKRNLFYKKAHHLHFPNEILIAFVKQNIGRIEVFRDDESALLQLLKRHVSS